jgi:hypothetical protein
LATMRLFIKWSSAMIPSAWSRLDFNNASSTRAGKELC